MIELKNDQLVFSFPEIHKDAVCRIEFQRTLRIPDDNKEYPLPPGFGRFPLSHVDDFAANVPQHWREHGGAFLPMSQAEALWLNFSGGYPMAVKVAAGKIDAITGEAWKNELTKSPQDYVVIPGQPWLDGFCVGKGMIRQFVAMPLGEGYTAEEQITGEAKHGGLQIVVYPMKASEYAKQVKMLRSRVSEDVYCDAAPDREMGLAPGGLMRQKIYDDSHGIDVWETSVRGRCFVHILNSLQYVSITGSEPPTKPPTAKQYSDASLPWFDYYDADKKALKGAKKLANLDSVAAKKIKKGHGVLAENESVAPDKVIPLGVHRPQVREGKF